MDGQPRIGIYDVGADEVSNATIVRRPFTSADVGPGWKQTTSPIVPPGGGCNAAGCALQAESYKSILDPDGDGIVFSKVAVANALAGQVLKSPNGSTVTPPPQETVATYDMTFATAGTYTAYYRVRGFSGSSDSIYTPSTFAVDPTNALTTSSDSTFIWKKDTHTFPITAGNVGVPLEFRLSMREQQAEIDAIVLNLNPSLIPGGSSGTSAQLDALFTAVAGDYTGDHVVDPRDYVVWRKTNGQHVTAWTGADGNGDGNIDDTDYNIWRANFGASAPGSGMGLVEVPEPSSEAFTLVALLGMIAVQKRRSSRLKVR
jgi:hypothetical protein